MFLPLNNLNPVLIFRATGLGIPVPKYLKPAYAKYLPFACQALDVAEAMCEADISIDFNDTSILDEGNGWHGQVEKMLEKINDQKLLDNQNNLIAVLTDALNLFVTIRKVNRVEMEGFLIGLRLSQVKTNISKTILDQIYCSTN